MVNIEVRGIPCVFDDECLDDIELLEIVGELEGGNTLVLPRFLTAVFGEEQYENIKSKLRDERGKCRITEIYSFYKEAMEEAAKAKNAEAKN